MGTSGPGPKYSLASHLTFELVPLMAAGPDVDPEDLPDIDPDDLDPTFYCYRCGDWLEHWNWQVTWFFYTVELYNDLLEEYEEEDFTFHQGCWADFCNVDYGPGGTAELGG